MSGPPKGRMRSPTGNTSRFRPFGLNKLGFGVRPNKQPAPVKTALELAEDYARRQGNRITHKTRQERELLNPPRTIHEIALMKAAEEKIEKQLKKVLTTSLQPC